MRDALLRLHVVRLYLSNTFALHIPKTIEPREHVEISGVQKKSYKGDPVEFDSSPTL